MGYINSIKIAMLVFPVLAFFITLPYMIINYRKYGSINKLRTLILYSFVLYLLTMYFLVILPLPDPDTVHTTYTQMLNLVPFSSLFFELTQLSGLYCLYPGPYRLADIDDIIQNTTGGCIGYALGALAVWLLPSRDKIDEEALEAGLQVSQIRVGLSLLIDTFIVAIPYNLSNTTIPFSLFIALYFAVIPLFNGKTLGSSHTRNKEFLALC